MRKEGIELKVKIFTDTTCDLCPEKRAQHDITALPLHVILGEDALLEDPCGNRPFRR